MSDKGITSGHAPRSTIAKLCLAIAIALILVSADSQRYLGHVMESPDLDFYDYYFAAEVVHTNTHANLYAGASDGNPQLRSAPASAPIARVAQQHGISDTELYLYPPLFVDLLTPLTHLPLQQAAQLWRALNLLIVLGSMALLARLLRIPLLTSSFGLLVAVAYSFWPMHEAVSLGQITPVLLGLWSIGVVAYAEDMPLLSAFAFALATAFKVTPLLLLPLFFLWREWRWLTSYFVSLFTMIAVMFAWNGTANMLAFAHVIPAMGGILPSLQNKCIGSVLAWLYYGRVFTLITVHAVLEAPPRGLVLVAKIADATFLGTCLVLAWRRVRLGIQDHRAILIALFALATAVISPVSWRHGYTIALIPFAMLWIDALRHQSHKLTLWLLTIATVAVGSLIFDLAAQAPLPQPFKILCAAVWPLSCALLCLVTLASKRALRLTAGSA